MARQTVGRYGTIRYVDYDGNVHEKGVYYHVTGYETWRELVQKVERAARFQFGAAEVKKVVWLNGNAA